MSIKEWPEEERPREKLLRRGAATLSDAELLAIFLRTGVSGLSAVDLSRQLLQQFGSLRALLGAEQQDFCGAHGLGPAKYAQLQAVLEMGRRHLAEQLQRGEALTSPGLTVTFCKPSCGIGGGRCSPCCCSTTSTGSSGLSNFFTVPSTRRASGPEKSCRSRSNIMQPP